MRALLWVLGIVVALVLGAALLLPVLVDEQQLIEIAARRIEQQSGVKVTVRGDAALSLFPEVALTTSDVSILLPEGGASIEARYLQADVALMPLLRRSVEMQGITIDGLTVTQVAGDAAAAKTAELDTSTMSPAQLDAFYAARRQAREQAAARQAAQALAAPLALAIGELSLRNVRVRTVDEQGAPISELQLRYVTASDLNTAGRPVPLTALLVMAGDSPGDSTEVTVQGSATVAEQRAELSDLAVIVEGATAEPLQILANGEAALDTGVASLEITLSSGTLEGSGSVHFSPYASPMIDADLALTELNPALLLIAGPDAAAAAPASSGDAAAPLPLHALRMVDTRARLAIDSVVLGAHRLEQVSADLRVVDGVATLKPVSATLHGGDIRFEAVFNGRYNTARLDSSGAVEKLDVGRAAAALDSGLGASGSADLSWSLQGAGTTGEELMQSLNGPIEFTTADITLRDISVEGIFCRAIALVNQETLVADFPADTAFEALSATAQLAEGVVTIQPLTASLRALGLSGTGAVDLDSQDLRASLRAQLSPELGALDPACRVNERLAALRWPLECRGNLAGEPADWCRVNTTEIVRDLAENEAKRRVQEEAGKLLKKIFE